MRYECPVCSYRGLTVKPYAVWPPPEGAEIAPPYEDYLGDPSYEVCSRCGFEFGNDDDPGTAEPVSFQEHRKAWELQGRPWPSEFSGERAGASGATPAADGATVRDLGCVESGIKFIDPEDADRLEWEASSAGAAVYRFSTKGVGEGNSFFDAVRNVLPMDPPLVGSQSLDALSDSLWSGLYELDVDSVAIFWTDSSDYRAVASRGYAAILEILRDITNSLADRKLTVGKPKKIAIYIFLQDLIWCGWVRG